MVAGTPPNSGWSIEVCFSAVERESAGVTALVWDLRRSELPCGSHDVGAGTRICAFVHLPPGAGGSAVEPGGRHCWGQEGAV
jgi:hypothetical protein